MPEEVVVPELVECVGAVLGDRAVWAIDVVMTVIVCVLLQC